MLAHEAGYDAFMTGAVFARLAVLLGGAETVQAALPALAALRGRLNVTRWGGWCRVGPEAPGPQVAALMHCPWGSASGQGGG